MSLLDQSGRFRISYYQAFSAERNYAGWSGPTHTRVLCRPKLPTTSKNHLLAAASQRGSTTPAILPTTTSRSLHVSPTSFAPVQTSMTNLLDKHLLAQSPKVRSNSESLVLREHHLRY